jgi:hypothetical protein
MGTYAALGVAIGVFSFLLSFFIRYGSLSLSPLLVIYLTKQNQFDLIRRWLQHVQGVIVRGAPLGGFIL